MILAGKHSMLGSVKPMKYALFDGTDSSPMLADIGYFTTTSLTKISLSTWIRVDRLPPAGPVSAVALQQVNLDNGIQLDPCSSGELIPRVGIQYIVFITANRTFGAVGAWHHYAFTYDGSIISGYCDGVVFATATASRWLNQPAALVFSLGRRSFSYNNNTILVGGLANVNFYSRSLASSEIQKLASDILVVPSDAEHQWLFANEDGLDTGVAATKWNMTVGATTVFEKLSTGGGGGRLWLLLCRSSRARRSLERRAA